MSQSHGSYPWYSVFFRSGHLLALGILIVITAGLSALNSLPRLEDPRIDTRNALVITPYPGASAERVEALVTDVLEDQLRQVFEIKEIKSTSRAGISILNIELQDWVDSTTNEGVFSKVRDELDTASDHFPSEAGEPLLDEKRGASAFTLIAAVKPADGIDLNTTTRTAEELADRLRNVSGTELVRLYGDPDEEVIVTLNINAIRAAGLTVANISQQIQAADPKLPAGAQLDDHEIRIQVASPLDAIQTLTAIPIRNDNGQQMRLGDVAQIQRGWQRPTAEVGLLDGQRVVFVGARMQPNVRVDHWTESAQSTLARFNSQFSGTVTADAVFVQNDYTSARLSDLTQNLLMGCAVVMVVIWLFMGLRASWIVGLALPLCSAFALFSLSFFDEQIHQMSIFGIIIAIGLLIDNAIVITDEIRINLLNKDNSRLDAYLVSLRHLFAPLLASTLTTILGFMPIFLLNGNIGDFIGSIAISVVMALIGSLSLSMTLIAALAARYLPRNAGSDYKWYRRGLTLPEVSQRFQALMTAAIRRPLLTLPICIGLPVIGFGLSSQLGNVFFPSADRNQFEIYLWMPHSTAIERTADVTQQVDDLIQQQSGVTQTSWLVGGSAPSVYYNQIMTRDNSPFFANGVVTTGSVSAAANLIPRLQHRLEDAFPEAQLVVRPFGQGPPIPAPVEVDIYGPDLSLLASLGEQVRHAMAEVPGLTQSTASITLNQPELVFDAKREQAMMAGLSLSDIAIQLQQSLEGRTGGSILEATEQLPIRVRTSNDVRASLTDIRSLTLFSERLPNSMGLPLGALGDFELKPVTSGITRTDGQRVNRIQAFLLPNMPAITASQRLQGALAELEATLPDGYRIAMAGDADQQQEAIGKLSTYAPVLLVMMITTLILTFTSVRLAVVIGVVAVLSVGLGMFSLWLSGLPIGFNPILGCAGLIGVAINGSIVVIAAIKSNSQAKRGDIATIVQETMGCSRHILSTTFTTVGGFIPLLLFSSGSFWPPLAVVLAGGVGFSVLLSLFFTPTVLALLSRHRTL